MFFKKNSKDCIELLNDKKSIIGRPFHNRFLASASYSYPSHSDPEVMSRIYYQKKLIDENGVFETTLSLACNTAHGDDYVKFKKDLIQDFPHWADKNNFSQSFTVFKLNGISYIAEQHSSNFNCVVCLYKEKEVIFNATLIGYRANEANTISINSSKLDPSELKLLIAFANLSEEIMEKRRNASSNTFAEKKTENYENQVKQNF